MGRQQRDADTLLDERATEWVGVCGQCRSAVNEGMMGQLHLSRMYLWATTRNLRSTISFVFIAVVWRSAIPDDPDAGSRSTIRDPKIVTSLQS